MDKENLLQIVRKYVNQALSGQEVEMPKFDLKRQWYKLETPSGINEFLKDTSSIANTVGPDGFIVIGVDEKECKQYGVSFSDSGLKDSNELAGLINKRIDRAFDINYFEEEINGQVIGVLHIPPSIDKPHVIKSYQKFDKEGKLKSADEQRIFVRSGTITKPASKFDLELMIYDRKNIQPDYILDLYINQLRFGTMMNRGIKVVAACTTVCIENIGKRPASIEALNLNISFQDFSIKFGDASTEYVRGNTLDKVKVDAKNLIVRSNEILQRDMDFFAITNYKSDDLNNWKVNIQRIEAKIFLNNGKEIICDCEIPAKILLF